MNLMTWSEHFVSGIDTVDAQHKALVEMINAAAPQLASGGELAHQTVGPLLDELVGYAASHFLYEENLMRQAGVLPE
jgi:hemerythrin-like metal-binding protein